GGELTADEVVSGSFRNISGTVNSVDANAKTITVEDLVTKKPVVVTISATSQLRKLPAPMAQRIAARLKGGSGEDQANESTNGAAPASQSGNAGNTGNPPARAQAGGSALEQRGPGASGGRGGAGGQGGDLQQAITRMPASNLTDLQKGDAVMIVATSDNTGA